MTQYSLLSAELNELDYVIEPDALQMVLDGKIKLTHGAHQQFDKLMQDGQALFAEPEEPKLFKYTVLISKAFYEDVKYVIEAVDEETAYETAKDIAMDAKPDFDNLVYDGISPIASYTALYCEGDEDGDEGHNDG